MKQWELTLDGMTVFVNNALPGEIVSAKILKGKKNFAFAKIEKIKKESPDRINVELFNGFKQA